MVETFLFAGQLRDGLQAVIPHVDPKDRHIEFQNIFVQVLGEHEEPEKVILFGTDGYSAGEYTLDIPHASHIVPGFFYLPVKVAKELLKEIKPLRPIDQVFLFTEKLKGTNRIGAEFPGGGWETTVSGAIVNREAINYDKWIPTPDTITEAPSMSFDGKYLTKFTKLGLLEFKFHGSNKATEVRSVLDDRFYGLLMPIRQAV